tara:strand:+ start:463 stop:714 length:252 start_codon:yes stop_codon:yes gene_type:complete
MGVSEYVLEVPVIVSDVAPLKLALLARWMVYVVIPLVDPQLSVTVLGLICAFAIVGVGSVVVALLTIFDHTVSTPAPVVALTR